MKSTAMAIFLETIAQFTPVQLATDRGRAFRKIVGGRIIEECKVSPSSACTHYNNCKKDFAAMSPENTDLMKTVGRAEGKNNGGPKPKVKVTDLPVVEQSPEDANKAMVDELMALLHVAAEADADEATYRAELLGEQTEVETTLAEELAIHDEPLSQDDYTNLDTEFGN